MFSRRRFWGQDEAYVESQIERETVDYFEAERVKAPDVETAKRVFVATIKEKYGVDIQPFARLYAEPSGPEGWWRCSAYQHETDSVG